jgi:hypothetical protein
MARSLRGKTGGVKINLADGSWQMADGSWQMEVGSWQMEVGGKAEG